MLYILILIRRKSQKIFWIALLFNIILFSATSGSSEVVIIGQRSYDITEEMVNEYTSNKQQYPSVAILSSGKFIIGWESWYQITGSDCYGKLYSENGIALSSEILLNPYKTSGWEYGPAFIPLPGDSFAVAWGRQSESAHFQLFDNNLSPIGTDNLVTWTNIWPATSSAPDGNFVIAWGRTYYANGIYARCYDSTGAPFGSEFKVNTDPLGFTDDRGSLAAVACKSDGGFTIVWYNLSGDIRAQRYDFNRMPVDAEFTVNSSVGGSRYSPSIACMNMDEFIIVWDGFGNDDSDGIYARRFASDGTPLSDEWRVNDITSGKQYRAHIGVSKSNEFAISWLSSDDSNSGIFAQLYNSDSGPIGTQFQVNQYTDGNQILFWGAGKKGTTINGDMLIFTWYGEGSSDGEGVYLTKFNRLNNDVGVSTILTPVGIVALDTTITPSAVVTNFGKVEETFTVTFCIGDLCDSFITTIGPSEDDTLKFEDWHANECGTHVVKCAVDLIGDQYPGNDSLTGIVTVKCLGPEIYSVSPDHGGNTGFITVEIKGSGFDDGASVKLAKGESEIVVDSSLITVVDSTTIIATLDLMERELGSWNVVVTNPDELSGIFYNGFTVEIGYERLWIDIIGRDQIRAGRTAEYNVVLGNSGNVDAFGVILTINGIPSNATFKPGFEIEYPPHREEEDTLNWVEAPIYFESDGALVVPLYIPSVLVGETLSLKLSISVPTTTQFKLEASVSMLYFDLSQFRYFRMHGLLWHESDLCAMGIGGIECFAGIAKEAASFFIGKLATDCVDKIVSTIADIVDISTSSTGDRRIRIYSLGHLITDAAVAGIVCSGAAIEQFPPAKVIMKIWDIYNKIKSYADLFDKCKDYLKKLWDALLGIFVRTSWDPNCKVGLAGYGEAGFVTPDEQFQYVVYFENVDTAAVPAQEINIYDTLDVNLDWRSFTFNQIQLGDTSISLEGTGNNFNTAVALNDTVEVDISCNFDPAKGITHWHLAGINTNTQELADILPPNQNPPEGEGWTSFIVKPKGDLLSGTRIRNEAWIVFDVNPAMSTGEVVNTVDVEPPQCSLFQLADEQPLSRFEVRWSGEDDEFGSGIRDYSIYVSDNGGPYRHWLTTSVTSAMFAGENDHTYNFYTIARDNVGHRELADGSEAVTTIRMPREVEVSPNPFVPSRGHALITFFGAGVKGATIKVFNKAGELVQTLVENEDKDTLEWNGRSNYGNELASGVYIYILKNPSGIEKKGKFAIIR